MSRHIRFSEIDIDNVPVRWTTKEAAGFKKFCKSSSHAYRCTGPKNHEGPHFADGINRCIAMWWDQ